MMFMSDESVVHRGSGMLPRQTSLCPRGKIPDRYEVQYDDSDDGMEEYSVFRMMMTIIRS
jgi:hypothetical protein